MLDVVFAVVTLAAATITMLFFGVAVAVIGREKGRSKTELQVLALLPIEQLREAMRELQEESNAHAMSVPGRPSSSQHAVVLLLLTALELLGIALAGKSLGGYARRSILLFARAIMSLGLLLVVNHPLMLDDTLPQQLGIRVLSQLDRGEIRLLGTIAPNQIPRTWETLDIAVLEKLQDELVLHSDFSAVCASVRGLSG